MRRRFVFLIMFCLPMAGFADSRQERYMVAGAELARAECEKLIHFDTFEFEDCINKLGNQKSLNIYQQLGIAYFGYVGANDSYRMGMYGAESTAQFFLDRVRKLQRKTGTNSYTQCRIFPGDCEMRMAQMKALEALPVKTVSRELPVPVPGHDE